MLPAKLFSILLLTLGFALSFSVRADAAALDFKGWKEQQILQAQNQLLRSSNDLEAQKKTASEAADGKKASPKERAMERFRVKSAKSKQEKMDAEVKQAQEAVRVAMALGLEDYVSIYLPSLQDRPESLEKLLESLSKEELSKILAVMLKMQSDQGDSAPKGPSRVSQVLSSPASL